MKVLKLTKKLMLWISIHTDSWFVKVKQITFWCVNGFSVGLQLTCMSKSSLKDSASIRGVHSSLRFYKCWWQCELCRKNVNFASHLYRKSAPYAQIFWRYYVICLGIMAAQTSPVTHNSPKSKGNYFIVKYQLIDTTSLPEFLYNIANCMYGQVRCWMAKAWSSSSFGSPFRKLTTSLF